MKIKLVKIICTFFLLSFILGCQISNANGEWENIVIDSDNNKAITTLIINEIGDSFTGTITTETSGNINLEIDKLEISGYISKNILVIEEFKPNNNNLVNKSTLTLSEDGNTLTLSPSGLIFNKK